MWLVIKAQSKLREGGGEGGRNVQTEKENDIDSASVSEAHN